MRTEELDIWVAAAAMLFVTFMLPAYLGFIHATPGALLLYAIVAGTSLALAQHAVDWPLTMRPNARVLIDMVLRTLGTALIGGAAYALALWLI